MRTLKKEMRRMRGFFRDRCSVKIRVSLPVKLTKTNIDFYFLDFAILQCKNLTTIYLLALS